MKRHLLPWLALLTAFWASAAAADYLEVSRSVTLKGEPHGDAVILLRLEPGDLLPLIEDGQTNGYYHAETLDGAESGWVYRSFVRRYPGLPEAEPVVVARDLLDDPESEPTEAQRAAAARHLALGAPQGVYERLREGFVTAVDPRMKIPVWVQYELRPEDLVDCGAGRMRFRHDSTLPEQARAEDADYVHSGFDRGHMAPDADLSRSESVLRESYLLSNAAPQVGVRFNQGIWRLLEDRIRGYVAERGPLTVITGPVFIAAGDSMRYRVIGANHVAVPHAFYKIVVDPDAPGGPQALAFLIENRAYDDNDPAPHLVAIDAIERMTGLDFLGALSQEDQATLEAEAAPGLW